MTHPPYGDDERERRRDDDAPPGGRRSAEPPSEPPFGPPQWYGQPGATPQHGPPAQRYGPPQYGPPQNGPPPPGAPGPYGQPDGRGRPPAPPARRSRWSQNLVALLVLAAVLLVLPFLPGLGGSTALDPEAVQRDVAEQFEQREGVPVDLSCGSEMTVEAGRTYGCTGTTADGEPVAITITVLDEDANYTWSDG